MAWPSGPQLPLSHVTYFLHSKNILGNPRVDIWRLKKHSDGVLLTLQFMTYSQSHIYIYIRVNRRTCPHMYFVCYSICQICVNIFTDMYTYSSIFQYNLAWRAFWYIILNVGLISTEFGRPTMEIIYQIILLQTIFKAAWRKQKELQVETWASHLLVVDFSFWVGFQCITKIKWETFEFDLYSSILMKLQKASSKTS